MRKKPKTQNNITQINKRKQIEQLKGIKVKLTFILFTLMIAFVGLGVRVFYLKNVYGEKYETAAKNQQISSYDTEISPNRGKITDRNNQALAISTTVYNIVLDVRVLVQNTVEEQERTITALAETLEELDYATLKDYITINPETGKPNLDTSWKILAKEQSREVKEALEAQKLKGVVYNKDTKRRYPVETLAAQVIGFSRDTLWGLEKQYNSQMTGVAGRSFITYDGQNGAVAQEVPAEDGNTIVTTLDYTIQTYAEQAVQNAMAEYNPEFATTVVMNPNTGEIYAMAQAPTFNLNSPMEPLELANGNFETVWESMEISQQLEYLNNVWKNHNISSSFEPGSIVKPIVAATAVEEGVISSTDTFYCPGYKEVAGIRISCHLRSGHGIQTLEQGLANSCNVVMMEIGNKMGSQMLYDCLKDFGFGSLTGIDLPSEASASTLMYTPDKMGPTERATMSFGQSFNATTIQSISALAAAINGGDLMRPYIVSQVVDKDGNVVLENKPEVVRKVISQETSDIIRNDLVATVEYGTGKRAKISGYTYGGKTGTAEQGVRGSNQHTLSFIGFLPAENPQYVAITLIHKPENYATGITTVAPMMKTLFESIIQYKGVEPSYVAETGTAVNDEKKVIVGEYIGENLNSVITELDYKGLTYEVIGKGNSVVNQVPVGNTEVNEGSKILIYVEKGEDEIGNTIVPNVVGKTYDEAISILLDEGLTAVIVGDEDGVVVNTSPSRGVTVEDGAEITITLKQPEESSEIEE